MIFEEQNLKTKITRFEDMQVWQDAQNFAVEIYKITRTLPESEQYGIVSQIRRSASSVSANIAEGFGRASDKDRAHFYHIALGSLLESKNFIYLSARLEYIPQESVNELVTTIDAIQDQIRAILRYFRLKK